MNPLQQKAYDAVSAALPFAVDRANPIRLARENTASPLLLQGRRQVPNFEALLGFDVLV
jgi:hypothetical protein